jgi:heterotetrameric sarcosine oxidase delta subunit
MPTFPCPTCGRRPVEEFVYGGEDHEAPAWIVDPDARNVDEVWMFENPEGPTTERWFHAAGCRRWITIRRDTATMAILA